MGGAAASFASSSSFRPCNATIQFRGGGSVDDDDDKNEGDGGSGGVSLAAERWQRRQKFGSGDGVSTAVVAVAAAQRRWQGRQR
jgi:hypothetical protein